MNGNNEHLARSLQENNLELQQRSEELQTVRNELAQLLARIPAVLYTLKFEGEKVTPLIVSENIERLLGVTVAESNQFEWWLSSLHDDDRTAVLAGITYGLAHGGYTMEYRVRHKDGTYRWVEDKNHMFGDASGQLKEAVGVWTDITERKRTEESLRQSEARYRRLFETAHDGILILDALTGVILDVNPYLVELLGFSHDAILGKRLWDIGLLRDSAASVIDFLELQNQGYIRYEHLPLEMQDGRRADVEFVSNTYLVNGRKVIQCDIRDITERKRKEDERLRLSSLRAEVGVALVQGNTVVDLLQQCTEALVKNLDASYAFIWTLNESDNMLELQATTGLASPIDINCPFARAAIGQYAIGLIAQGPKPHATNAIQGDVRVPEQEWANQLGLTSFAGYPLMIKDRVVGAVAVFARQPLHEFTLKALEATSGELALGIQRCRSDQTLRESESRFRQLAENIQEVFWVSDRELTQILYISPAYERIWGRTCQSLYDHPVSFPDAVHPLDREKSLANLANQRQGKATDQQYRIVRPDGSERWIRDRSFPIRNERGDFYRIAGVVEDITERKNAERLALRSQRLEAIGTMAGGVAHDLNNALAPIMMGVEMLREQHPAESDIMDMFQTSAKRGADMVQHLMNFAKGAEGERVSIEPAQLVQEMQKLMNGSFPKHIKVIVKCDSKLPMMLGDATQLHQILLNLCVNARDAMPHGGTLTLEARYQEVDAIFASSIPDARPGNYLALGVRDTGTGISPEILDRIFEPFFTTKGPDEGTGLGLSTVMGIVKGHGGFLQVYSKLGQGSMFTAYVPADAAGLVSEVIDLAEAKFGGHGESILLVDDEHAVREMGRAVLRRLNFKPLTATDGADGLIQLTQHRTELCAIITDLQMPYMDGLAFVRALRRILPDIPVLVASGRIEKPVMEELNLLGVKIRLDKPFSELQLRAALMSLLAPKAVK